MPDTSPLPTEATGASQGLRSVSFALVGSGGAGVITAGETLLNAAAKAGYFGIQSRTLGPQIRGGESAALVRLSVDPVHAHKDCFDVLVAIDWKNAERFAAEIPLNSDSLIVTDPAAGEVPAAIAQSGARICEFPIAEIAKSVDGGRPNMVVSGAIADLVGLPVPSLEAVIAKKLARKGEAAIKSSFEAIEAGAARAHELATMPHLLATTPAPDGARWVITGNEATGLGALKGGIRFAAAYPITPSTEVVEWMAPELPKLGGKLVQVEDELAAINMIIGGSYAGIPSMTATSGPGLSLMVEALGLSVASEIPVLVVDVQRGGPSTGIPTKSEQSDLQIALFGPHGDAPHLVTAPLSVADCITTTQWSVGLMEELQSPCIMLTDQFMGQCVSVIDRPKEQNFPYRRRVEANPDDDYQRYALTESGISPMTIPGTKNGQYTSEGLEHTPRGVPSSNAEHHAEQMDKRQNKLDQFDYGPRWADLDGDDGDIALVTWGSVSAPCQEAARVLRDDGLKVRVIALRLLSPAPKGQLTKALKGVRRVLSVEQSHSGQFYHYLKGHFELPGNLQVQGFHRPGPLMIRPGDIVAAVKSWKD